MSVTIAGGTVCKGISGIKEGVHDCEKKFWLIKNMHIKTVE
jgi:hypothetical protein